MTVQDKAGRLTTADFLAFCELPENANRRFELINGVPVEMPPSSKKNTILAARVARLLGNHADQHNLGYVTGADGGYQLGPNDVRLPDAAFISKARAGGLQGVVFPTAPDLAVEVISPGETSRSVLDKVRAYLQAGTRLVWVVYPEDKVVDVYRLAGEGLYVQTLEISGVLDGGEVLSGFTLKLSELFAGF
jgi:Uma2 family endonuclease